MSVRMRDIADRLGISISTVSLALRSSPQVADGTRHRVLDVAEELGYTVRHRQSRSVLSNIAFIMRDELGNDFYSGVLSGAESECRRLGLALHFVQFGGSDSLRSAQFALADGLLVVGSIDEAAVYHFQRLELPMVLIDNNLPYSNVDRVLIENVPAVERAVHHVAQHGHRSIAFLCGPVANPSFRERRMGYRAAMDELGLPAIELYFEENDARDAERTLSNWVAANNGLGFTALIGCNDKASLRAFHWLHDYGIQVPHDISLVGFDDVDLASVMRPALTTSRVSRELLGRLGVQRLVERAHNPDIPAVGMLVSTALIERDSVATLEHSTNTYASALAGTTALSKGQVDAPRGH